MSSHATYTVLFCENGWTSLYDASGEQIGKYAPWQRHELNHQIHRARHRHAVIKGVTVPVDPRYKDFPAHL